MSKYFFACVTPTVELPVAVSDPAGKSATVKVGFKRYDIDEATIRFEEFAEANKPMEDLQKLMADDVEVDKSLLKAAQKEARDAMDAILRDEIVYFKDVQLFEEVPGKAGEYRKGLLIADSRTQKDDPEFGADGCLAFLLDMSISHSIWRNALISAMVSAISNTKLGKEAEVKN